jgi:hypothetical protein
VHCDGDLLDRRKTQSRLWVSCREPLSPDVGGRPPKLAVNCEVNKKLRIYRAHYVVSRILLVGSSQGHGRWHIRAGCPNFVYSNITK